MDLFDKIEQKRQEFNAYRNKESIGTFKGLEETIKRRRVAALMAQKKAEDAPVEEKSNAK